MMRNVSTIVLLDLVAAILLCSNDIVETVRLDRSEDQCLHENHAVPIGAYRRQATGPLATAKSLDPKVTTRPKLARAATLGAPVLQVVGMHPTIGATGTMMRPSSFRAVPHGSGGQPRFGSVLLQPTQGRPFAEPRYLIVALDPRGRPAGVPLFDTRQGQCTGALGAASTSAKTLVGQEDPLGWRIAEKVDGAIGAADMPFAVHAWYQLADIAAHHGDNMQKLVANVQAEALDQIGAWAKAAHIIPHTNAHTSVLAGLPAGAHLTAGAGTLTAGLSLVVNGRQVIVSGQKMQQVERRKEEIWNESAQMSHEEYDAAMNQLDAVYEHNGMTVALSLAGAASAGIGGTLGVMTLAGTAPAWAPPVALAFAIGGAGVGMVSLARMWLDEEPDMLLQINEWHDTRTVNDTASSFLEHAKLPSMPSGHSSSIEPEIVESDFNSKAMKHDYLQQIVLPRWNSIFARKHNLIPFYIDAMWRHLRTGFGARMKYIRIRDRFEVTGAPLPDAFQKPLDREWLINLLQLVDHPDNKKWWVSPLENSKKTEVVLKGSSEGVGVERPAFFSTPLEKPRPGESCINKGPSPDTYCERLGHFMCDFVQFKQGRVFTTGLGKCVPARYPTEAVTTTIGSPAENHGVIATLNGEVAELSIDEAYLREFSQYWARLHGF